MQQDWNDLSPFVRLVKITKTHSLAGEWQDYDNVFTYIAQGEAIFVLDGVSYQIAEGDAIVMYPFMPHLIRSTSDEPLIQYIIHFDCFYHQERSKWTDIGKDSCKQQDVFWKERLFAQFSPVVHIREVDQMDIKRRFLTMYKEFMDRPAVYSLMLKSHALELLAIFLRNQIGQLEKERKATKGWSIIEKAINAIQQSFDDPALDNALISERVGVSPSHLTHLFKEQLGITIHKYLTYVRIEQAKKRILESDVSLTQIAEQSGFSSIHHFSRIFKSTVGMTASQFLAVHSKRNKSEAGE